jgi:hypothetical protein
MTGEARRENRMLESQPEYKRLLSPQRAEEARVYSFPRLFHFPPTGYSPYPHIPLFRFPEERTGQLT